MGGRLEGKSAIVVGAGQTPGETIGNGRATAILFAREGAKVLAVDRDIESAQETVSLIEAEGGQAWAYEADATDDVSCEAFVSHAIERFGVLDILRNNVGIGMGDPTPEHLDEDAWDRILAVNLKSVILPCKHAVPVMKHQGFGSIVNISSAAALASMPTVAYKVSKAGINAYTQSLAIACAAAGVRANVIMPGLMDTPMAIEGISTMLGVDKNDLIALRDSLVPLRHKMGTAWDVAHAAVFLASDEASFITGVALPVDGGQTARVG